MGATTELASYIVGAKLADIPSDVRQEAQRALLNYVGCAVGGSREPAVDIAHPRARALLRQADCPRARRATSARSACTRR